MKKMNDERAQYEHFHEPPKRTNGSRTASKMKKINTIAFSVGLALLTVFVLWTVIVCIVDVQPVGPEGSEVGFAALNTAFHRLTGLNMWLYEITDILSVIPFIIVAGFGVLGAVQLIRRRSLSEVDHDILALGVFYIIVLAVFALFEVVEINYRPVLIEGVLEASYPSSTTMLALCVLPTAVMQFDGRIKYPAVRHIVCTALILFTAFMVAGRLISGVHWLTDIIGGALFAAGMVTMYGAVIMKPRRRHRRSRYQQTHI